MVKIAICDDEEKSVVLHEKTVKECLQLAGIGYEITTYTQSQNLLYDITDDAFFYDLILLDIEILFCIFLGDFSPPMLPKGTSDRLYFYLTLLFLQILNIEIISICGILSIITGATRRNR